jgi:hypothetical protein
MLARQPMRCNHSALGIAPNYARSPACDEHFIVTKGVPVKNEVRRGVQKWEISCRVQEASLESDCGPGSADMLRSAFAESPSGHGGVSLP